MKRCAYCNAVNDDSLKLCWRCNRKLTQMNLSETQAVTGLQTIMGNDYDPSKFDSVKPKPETGGEPCATQQSTAHTKPLSSLNEQEPRTVASKGGDRSEPCQPPDDGPGEEDGPWAEGWEQRTSQPPVPIGIEAEVCADTKLSQLRANAEIVFADATPIAETPETDKFFDQYFDVRDEVANFARRLERERNALRQQVADLQNALRITNQSADDQMFQKREVEAERDASLAKVRELEDRWSRLPADWFSDSSLETWFPITADRIAALEAEVSRLQKLHDDLSPCILPTNVPISYAELASKVAALEAELARAKEDGARLHDVLMEIATDRFCEFRADSKLRTLAIDAIDAAARKEQP